jgi:hypothetical protein
MVVPKINEPSHEMVGVRITVAYYGQNNCIFGVCFTFEIINCNEFHSDLISLFEKLDKNVEIGNNE